jgi:hypothetical protein
MATDRPPPYFPQGTLSPPDEGRYKKFKLAMLGAAFFLLLLLAGLVLGIAYLLKWIF